ncbi:Type IV fimbrial assembly protein PilC [Chitinispirillum alkaliphilum]|nr:Type IV fimbrial assembly protein PilC [Chitinispirillum alkaliphilum]
MPRFSYEARDYNNHFYSGTMEEATYDDVLEGLTNKGLIPVNVFEFNFDGTRKNVSLSDRINNAILKMQTKVPYKSVVFFTRQLATMIEGGVPLSKSLEQLAKAEQPVFKKIILQVAEDISTGHTFSDALAKHPGAFNNMYIAVIRSGELSGALSKVLDQMSTYLENVEAMKSKVKAALRYPIFIGGFVTLLIIGILWKLVPVFQGVYSSLGGQLPRPTVILIGASDFVRFNIPLVFAGVIFLYILFRISMTNDGFKTAIHKNMFRLPIFGNILRKNILATYCRTMALLMNSGTSILEATQIAGAVVNNKLYAKSLESVYANLRQGEMLSSALEKTGVFPVLVVQLVSTGEEAGRVDTLLIKAAEFYEREIKNVVDSLASIIEPVLIILLSAIVGSILVALYFPIFNVGRLIQ